MQKEERLLREEKAEEKAPKLQKIKNKQKNKKIKINFQESLSDQKLIHQRLAINLVRRTLTKTKKIKILLLNS